MYIYKGKPGSISLLFEVDEKNYQKVAVSHLHWHTYRDGADPTF